MTRGHVSVRILVADDHEQVRATVCAVLRSQASFDIVCEVPNGMEAVNKAEELQPDVAVLDVAMPQMNGLEAAALIRQIAPGTRVVFLSSEISRDVVEAALATGAFGYVVKSRLRLDLIDAVHAACRGRRFLSSELLS